MQDDERDEWIASINRMDDEELMLYIQGTWHLDIWETTWLKVGNECYWKDPVGYTSGIYTICEIRYDENDYDDALTNDTII